MTRREPTTAEIDAAAHSIFGMEWDTKTHRAIARNALIAALHQQETAQQSVTADQRQRVGQALCLVDRETCVCAHDKRPFPGAWCASIVALANAALAALAAPADERRGQIAKIIFDAAVGVSNWDNEFWAEAREGCFETADKVLALTALDRGGWQPIETAPKDGTAVWVSNGFSMRVAFWAPGKEFEHQGSTGGGWRDFFEASHPNRMADLMFAPSCWQALPKSPHRCTQIADIRPER